MKRKEMVTVTDANGRTHHGRYLGPSILMGRRVVSVVTVEREPVKQFGEIVDSVDVEQETHRYHCFEDQISAGWRA